MGALVSRVALTEFSVQIFLANIRRKYIKCGDEGQLCEATIGYEGFDYEEDKAFWTLFGK